MHSVYNDCIFLPPHNLVGFPTTEPLFWPLKTTKEQQFIKRLVKLTGIISELWNGFQAKKSMKPFQISINHLEIFLDNLNSCPTLLKPTTLNRHGCKTELSKGHQPRGNFRKNNRSLSRAHKQNSPRWPWDTSSRKRPAEIIFKRSLEILPVEGNRAPLLQAARRCRAATVALMSCSPAPSPGYPLASRSCTLACRQLLARGQPRVLHWPRHLLRSEDEQRLYPLAAHAFLFLKLGLFALGM